MPNDRSWCELAGYFWKEFGKDADWFKRQTWTQLKSYCDAMREKKTYATMQEAIEAGLKRHRRG